MDPRKIFPYRLPRVSRWALAALALGAGLGFVPEYRSKAYVEKQQDAQAIKEVGKTHCRNHARDFGTSPARLGTDPQGH
jgi:hypothetical protein